MPDDIAYYRVTVNKCFEHAGELFRPGVNYRVKPEIFNSIVEDVPFSSLCKSVVREPMRT